MVTVVAVTLTAVNLISLADTSIDVAIASSEMAGRQVQNYVLRRIADSTLTAHDTEEAAKAAWTQAVAEDEDMGPMLEQLMAQSRSFVEVNVAGEDGTILASSNPRQRGAHMVKKPELRTLREASPAASLSSILGGHGDYETRLPLGIAGQKTAVFTTQILVSPVLFRAAIEPELKRIAIWSGLGLALTFAFSYWLASLVVRPLTRIEHLIDDIASGKETHLKAGKDEARELAVIQSKLSLLGERYRGARDDASQLRLNLEGVLEKLDAGARRQFETQLALAQRLTAINSLTGRVAHEIKNPLNSIALRLEMLRSRLAEESPDSEPEFTILAEEVTRLDRVVRTFLDFNRPVELCPETLDAGQMAAEILHLLEPEAARSGIGIEVSRPDGPVVVKADPGILRQALLNIFVNAIEAMENGGTLRVKIEKELGSSSDACSITIADTGPGIAADRLDKIFQLYFTTKPHGSGIGLAMTYRAVQLHGGTIEVESEPGRGTTFHVLLPLAGVETYA